MMITSIREQITLAIVATTGGTAQLGSRIWRSRQEAFSRANFPALVIEPVSNEPRPRAAGYPTLPQSLDLRFLLMVDDPQPDAAADPILVELHARIMADVTLNGLSDNIVPGDTTWGLEINGIAVVETHYVVTYRTRLQDLASG